MTDSGRTERVDKLFHPQWPAHRGRSERMGPLMAVTLALLAIPLPSSSQQVDVWSRPIQVERSRDCDFIHYRVELSFDLEHQVFEGENLVTFTPLRDGVDRCELDAEELVIGPVIDEAGNELLFSQSDSSITVMFPGPLLNTDTARFTIQYRGEGSREGFFFDEETDDHPRMVSTDSWPNEAHHWIPLYDYPHDKVTHDLIITVPEGNKVLSNGRLVMTEQRVADETVTYRWAQEEPHSTYLMMLAIGPFEVVEDSLGDLPIRYWVYPGAEDDAGWIFEKTPEMIAYYSDLFDFPYPWAKYDQVTTPHVGGGAEATSATILGDGVIHDRRAEQDFSWERIIAHEIAHQWWGDLITLREWSHTWMNESFGTYSDYLWTRHEKGEDEGAWDLLGKKNQYLREARTRYQRPIVFDRYERPHDNFDSHTYPKGAVILHQLRYLLGDEAFFRTLSTFLHEHAFEAVDTHDFMKTVKDVTGQNLDWFFEQFLFRPGHPVFEIDSEWHASTQEIRLHLRQVQDQTNGTPIFRTPVQIGIVTKEERRIEEVWLDEETQTFVFESATEPLLVRFDEGNWLMKEWTYPKSARELLYQAQHDDVIGREWALRELAASVADTEGAPNEVRSVLAASASTDPFWAVRVAALEALGVPDGPGHADLLQAAAGDESSKVRTTAIRLLGDARNPDWIDFFKARFDQDDSYLVQAEAIRSIGKAGDRAQVPFLEEALAVPSHQDVIRRAAESAMEELLGG